METFSTGNMPPKTTYMICATPRSGSTLLCEALRNTGVAGNPDEYFGPMHVPRWSEQWQVANPTEYVGKVLKQGSTTNGVFGVKIMNLYWKHFMETLWQAADQYGVSDHQHISSTFLNMHYIWITRRNKIRQGVSWAKALQGIPWTWDKPEDFIPKKKLEFQFDVIDQFIEETVLHEAAWQEYFAENQIEPFVVVYEDFVRSYHHITLTILKYLNIPFPQDTLMHEPTLKQQADELSDEWVSLYQTQKEKEWKEKGWSRIGY